MKSARSKACDISKKVKDEVWERDEHRCILCWSSQAMPNAHYIPRSMGGLGIAENIVTLCIHCHDAYDHTVRRAEIGEKIKKYLQEQYPEWDEGKLIFKKWG